MQAASKEVTRTVDGVPEQDAIAKARDALEIAAKKYQELEVDQALTSTEVAQMEKLRIHELGVRTDPDKFASTVRFAHAYNIYENKCNECETRANMYAFLYVRECMCAYVRVHAHKKYASTAFVACATTYACFSGYTAHKGIPKHLASGPLAMNH